MRESENPYYFRKLAQHEVKRIRMYYSGIEVRDLSQRLKFYRSLRLLIKRPGTLSHWGKWVHLIDPEAQPKFVRSFEKVNSITSGSSLMISQMVRSTVQARR